MFAYQVWEQLDEVTLRNDTWYCCPQKHSEVVPYRRYQRQDFWVCSHFKTKPEGYCPIGESEQHKAHKLIILSLLEEGKLSVTDNLGLVVDLAKVAFTKIPQMESRWDTPKQRRADVLLPFEIFHPYLGRGIIFEVQLSSQEDNQRTDDWLMNGFSVSWLSANAFSDDSEGIKQPIVIQYPYITVLRNLSKNLGGLVTRLNTIEDWQKRIWKACKTLMLLNRTCLTCGHSQEDQYSSEGGIVCWQHRKGNRPSAVEPWDSCQAWVASPGKLYSQEVTS